MKKTVAVLKSTTPAKRFLSVIIALSMIFVSLPYLGMDYIPKASALTGDGNVINSDTKNTSITAMSDNHVSSSDSRFTYTGKITKAKTTLFDYVSDYELMNSYNNVVHKEGGFDDAYTSFNNAISQSATTSTPLYSANNNITITLSTTSFDRDLYVYLWDDSSNKTPWPGKKMVYDSVNNRYTYTFNRSDSGSPYYLSFNPKHLIFNDGSGNQSPDINQNLTTGKKYQYTESGSDDIIYIYKSTDSPIYLCYWDDVHGHTLAASNPNTSEHKQHQMTYDSGNSQNIFVWSPGDSDYVPRYFTINNGNNWEYNGNGGVLPWDGKVTTKGFTYTAKWNNALGVTSSSNKTYSCTDSTQNADPIYKSEYTYPLYFGCFWRSNRKMCFCC